jgi:hypothetical protein
VSVSKRRKSRVKTPPIASKSCRTQRRPLEAAILHRHPFRVSAANLPRRKFLHLAAGAAALTPVSRIARAQTYPTRPITMIVPIGAGTSADVVGRVVTERMGTSLGQPIIIENVTGADGSIGTGRAARAKPDGLASVTRPRMC